MDPVNIPGCSAIIDSIKKQWAKADQDVFIAAIILNLFIKISPFSPQLQFLLRAGIFLLLKRLYCRFFSHTETADDLAENMWLLFSNLDDYFGGKGICADMPQYCYAIT